MLAVFENGRRKCGVAALIAALVFTGAWLKSAIDQDVIPRLEEYGTDERSLSGEIAVFVSTNPIEWNGHRPETHWYIKGFYTEAQFTFAPEQVQAKSPGTIHHPDATFLAFEEGPNSALHSTVVPMPIGTVVPAIQSEADDSVRDLLIQTSGNLSVVELMPPQRAGALPFNSSLPIVNEDFGDETDEPAMITSHWQWGGFLFEQSKSPDAGDGTCVLIPHWSIVIPLFLLGAMLLVSPRGVRNKIPAAADLDSDAAHPVIVKNPRIAGRFFQGWRRKVGVVTLLASAALTCGWVRSSIVTDLIHVPVWPQIRMSLASANEGLVCQADFAPMFELTAVRYRMITGRAHQELSFRPLIYQGSLEGMEIELAESLPSVNSLVPLDDRPQSGPVRLTADESVPLMSTVILPSAPSTPTPEVTPWVGTVFGWAGLYHSRAPTDMTIVIPYALMVIPLTLLSGVLLVRPRFAKSKRGIGHFSF